MNDDQFSLLVRHATHAVNKHVPVSVLRGLDANERTDLFFRINDALTPILRGVINIVSNNNPTRASTIAALLSELLETHVAKSDAAGDSTDDRPSHVISEVHRTSANIKSIASCDIEKGTQIYLALDDRSAFRISVEAVSL